MIIIYTEQFNVTGMTCASCSAHVEKAVSKTDGVISVSVNLLTNSMEVAFDENKTNIDAIIKAVSKAGYGASPKNHHNGKDKKNDAPRGYVIADEITSIKKRLIASAIFLVPLFYISMGHMMNWPLPGFFLGHENAITFAFTQFILVIPIVVINLKYFKNGFKALFHGSPNMDSLIAIGSAAAVIYGIYAIYQIGAGLGSGNMETVHTYSMDLYFESAGTILTLITLGKFLEARAKGKTSDAITKLINLRPKTAVVLRNGAETEIPVEDVAVGDILIVKQGNSIPVDGVVVQGSSAVDESAITGESLPVEKNIGDKVTGATINKSGYLQIKASKVGDDTALAQIIRLVEEASSTKAPISKLADKISGVFVPIVIIIALLASIIWLLLGYSFEFALSIGISVLVISCPCALGLATPTAIMVGTGRGAQYGILIKSAETLETAHKLTTVVLDKTGTVTLGKPQVTDILPVEGTSKDLLITAASVEKLSEHPLAKAIAEKCEEENLTLYNSKNFNAVEGQGISAEIDGKIILAGNEKMMTANSVDLSPVKDRLNDMAQQGKTPLCFAANGRLLGVIAVADVIKPTSKNAVQELYDMGLNVVMLTGDNETTAQAIGKESGIKTVIAGVLPQGKEEQIRKLQEKGETVAMVGDGINDAPALARANVGIAIGAGTDIAMESADVVLVKSNLTDVAKMIQLSKATIRNIKENLFWALIYNSIGIPLAAGLFYGVLGWKLNPMYGAAAMSLSSVCVVMNALRLKTFKPRLKYTDSITDESNPSGDIDIKIQKNKGDFTMEKKIIIEGMACSHCSGRVEQALNAIDGVSATVDLNSKTATVKLSKDISDEALKAAVTDAGYTPVEIK